MAPFTLLLREVYLPGEAGSSKRTQLALLAMHNCRASCQLALDLEAQARCIESAIVHLRLVGVMVASMLSSGAKVWGVQLAAKASCGATGSAAEMLQLSGTSSICRACDRPLYCSGARGRGRRVAAVAEITAACNQLIWLQGMDLFACLLDLKVIVVRRVPVARCQWLGAAGVTLQPECGIQLAGTAATPARQCWAA